MNLIGIVVFLIIVGVALYLVSLIPMDATIKKVINVLIILFIVLYALQALGVWTGSLRLR